jgi:hypothetical protein
LNTKNSRAGAAVRAEMDAVTEALLKYTERASSSEKSER